MKIKSTFKIMLGIGVLALLGCQAVAPLSFEEQDNYEWQEKEQSSTRSVQFYDQEQFDLENYMDLNEKEVELLGSVAMGKEENLYLSTDLRKGELIHLDPHTFSSVPLELATVGLINGFYSENLNKTFIYDEGTSTVNLLHPDKHHVLGLYVLPNNPNSENASLAYDYTREVLYIALPVENKILVMDVRDGMIWDTIEQDLTGETQVMVYEPAAKLLLGNNGEIMIYDGLNDFELIKTIEAQGEMYVDQARDVFYVGTVIYDALNYEKIGEISDGNRVLAMDHEDYFLVTLGENEGQTILYALSPTGEASLGEKEIDFDLNKATYLYEEKTHLIYVYDGISKVWSYLAR
ncbi:hypothetical protein HN748_06070 [Candidatus Peregrinibacteria bacterium]|jgi:hypothetical protein|nr:hypothetical protein [Candidatus Peregrinibacteria bacterium]MBT7484206.1 hypothetical protein [Candidatus Peregrinibacteria bacterium]MBT7703771.1 hypothetical protein [Candidatus Peregrinibacteria bacterium]